MGAIPTPNLQHLLPPLLACLPTAFASHQPPPSLTSLLSPVLRQRLQLITSPHENWLRLLSWDRDKGDQLVEVLKEANFEPHPVSGEIEVGEVEGWRYRRYDEETLRAWVGLLEFNVSAVYLWCVGTGSGENGKSGDWLLTGLEPLDERTAKDPAWFASIAEADQHAQEHSQNGMRPGLQQSDRKPSLRPDEDDDYWNQYDKSPGRTPAANTRSPGPNSMPVSSEQDYYARYGEVQPAMDNHDPEEEMDGMTGSLDGNALSTILGQHSHSQPPNNINTTTMTDRGLPLDDPLLTEHDHNGAPAVDYQPVPSSPSSQGSDTVARLEKTAEQYSASEAAVKQHISTSMKSMYRLARSSGIEREEFGNMIRRELEMLRMLDGDE